MQELLVNPFLESSLESWTIPEPVVVGLIALAATAALAAAFLVAAYVEMIFAENNYEARRRAQRTSLLESSLQRKHLWLSGSARLVRSVFAKT